MNSCNNDDDEDRISVTPQLPPTITAINPSSTTVGEEVVITGTNFSKVLSDNEVSFNGRTALITSVTDTSITAVVPSGATTGPVSVTVKNFTSPTGPTFTVNIPAHTITSINPDNGGVGTIVTISGTNFSDVAEDNIVKFNTIMAVVTASTTTSITTTVPVGATTGPISVEIAGRIESGPDFTVPSISNLVVPINTSEDDIEEGEAAGFMELGSSDLELGEFDTSGTPDLGLQNIGLRFNNVTIPPGATILSASIQFTCDNIGADPVELTIFGENTGNAMAYTADAGNLSVRPLTTANKVWAIPEWVTVGDKLEAQKTVDIANIIQEIVNRGDWTSGNSVNIIMKHTGVSIGVTSSSGGREAETFDGSAAPELLVEFQ